MSNKLRLLTRGALTLLGWNPSIHYGGKVYGTWEEPLTKMGKRKVVFLYTHSSYWDFFIFMLYYWAVEGPTYNILTLVKPQAFDLFSWLLTRLGCIPSSRLEDKGSGKVKEIVKDLKKMNHFILLINPKGSREYKEWRSGWKVIAKETDALVVIGGLNYKRKELLVESVYTFDELEMLSDGKQEIMLDIKMTAIHPLYPHYGHHYNLPDQTPIDLYCVYLALLCIAIGKWPLLIYMHLFNMAMSLRTYEDTSRRLQDVFFTCIISFVHYFSV